MTQLWTLFSEYAAAAGLSAGRAGAAASALCVLVVLALAAALGGLLAAIGRRLMTHASDTGRRREHVAVFLRRASRFLAAWILAAWLPDALRLPADLTMPLSRLFNTAVVFLGAATLSGACAWLRSAAGARTWENTVFASKTLFQTLNLLLWLTAAVVGAATLMGKSPTFVLSGLGALTAVLMLIFRDSLLGLVAGIQVSQNDMVRIGDWITLPRCNADGTVIDIALTTVKVRNFDNTVTMIPSSALISDSFVNWRYMSLSKGRRIKRPVWISVTSIRELTDDTRRALIERKLLDPDDRPISNLAAFEIWLRRLLAADTRLTSELTHMVRQTEAGDTGIPVEVYAFTRTRDWEEYEAIQTDLFDRIYVTVPKFGLQIYQRTSDQRA